MNNRKKVSIPTAVENHSVHDLSCNHTTTADFMQFNPIKVLPVVPKHGYSLNLKSVVRLDAMPKPTMGHANLHAKWFFVPYRTIYPAWHEFYNDTNYTSGVGDTEIPVNSPMFSNQELLTFLLTSKCSTRLAEYSSIAVYRNYIYDNAGPILAHDFSVVDSNTGVVNTFVFTPYGRQVYKILRSLGYQVTFVNTTVGSNYDFYHSALSLLAYIKIYMDWYYPSAYYNDSRAIGLNKLFNLDIPMDEYLVAQEFEEIFDMISNVCYDDDYFVNVWDNPTGPNDGSFNLDVAIPDVTFDENGTIRYGTNGTPLYDIADSGNGSITQYGLRVLRSLTDYSRRHQIAGARVIDRVLAQWGVKLDPALLRRSYYLGGNNDYVKFSDVYSNADTTGAQLGDYAGRGYGENTSYIDFAPQSEHGIIMCISTIVPQPAYYQGQDPMTLCNTKLAFYNPEFDNLAVQAVGLRELFVPMKQGLYNPVIWNDAVWGFSSQYSQYKRSYDQLTGDFVLDSLNQGEDSWHLFRAVDNYFPNADSLLTSKHNINFMRGFDASQYNRIFYNTSNTADHFKIVHIFDIESRFPGKSMYEEYDFENEDSANKVNIDINGVKAN